MAVDIDYNITIVGLTNLNNVPEHQILPFLWVTLFYFVLKYLLINILLQLITHLLQASPGCRGHTKQCITPIMTVSSCFSANNSVISCNSTEQHLSFQHLKSSNLFMFFKRDIVLNVPNRNAITSVLYTIDRWNSISPRKMLSLKC